LVRYGFDGWVFIDVNDIDGVTGAGLIAYFFEYAWTFFNGMSAAKCTEEATRHAS